MLNTYCTPSSCSCWRHRSEQDKQFLLGFPGASILSRRRNRQNFKNMENHVFQAEKALPPGKDMHEMPRGCLYKGAQRPRHCLPPLVPSPTTGSVGQTSMPNVFPTSSGQLHLEMQALLLLPTRSQVL